MQPEEEEQRTRRLAIIGGVIATVLLLGVILWVAREFSGEPEKPARTVQVVQVVRPPPPPPPEETPPPPPPEKVEEPLPQDEPEPAPSDEPAPSEQLGLDAEGTAGGDGFGLAARKGGRDITGGGGAIFAWYTTRLKDNIVERLSDDPNIRAKKFSLQVRVWIDADGRVRDVRLANTTGDRTLDGAIESALSGLPKMTEPPPVEMPQPISLRIVSRS
jgi:periplasmic protein TonB